MDFLHTEVAGKTIHRLGLAASYGIDGRELSTALEDRGLSYIFIPQGARKVRAPLREALKKDRERYVVATGPSVGFLGWNVRQAAESMLEALGTDYLDVFQLFWLGVGSAWTEATMEALLELKSQGKVRRIGISIHDRPRAGAMAETEPLDLFMVRYNAAHPGAERDIFPHLEKRKPKVVAYTATAWRKLLRAPKGWNGATMSPADCYRFCLSDPHVDVTLCGPASLAELDANIAGLARGPLSAEEQAWMREYGRLVHG